VRSTDDLANLTYSYDFDDDGAYEVAGTTTSLATVPAEFLGDGPATATVRAVVADDDGGSLELRTEITITNAAATVTVDGPSTAVVGTPVTIKVGALDPSPDDMAGTFTYVVDWGDGTPPVTLDGPSDPPVTHTYDRAGSFDVVATVTDPDGAMSDPLTFPISVVEQLPPTTAGAPTTAPDSPPTTAGAPTTAPDSPPTTAGAPTSAPTGPTSSAPAATDVAGGGVGPTTTAAPPSGALPRTGAETAVMLLIALGLVAAGVISRAQRS
jgi:hypothetical protein